MYTTYYSMVPVLPITTSPSVGVLPTPPSPEIQEVTRPGNDHINTNRSTRYAINLYNSWVERKKGSGSTMAPIDCGVPENLATLIPEFLTEIRQRDGSRYSSETVKVIFSGLNRHLNRHLIDLNSDEEFRECREIVNGFVKELKVAEDPNRKTVPPIPLEKELVLWTGGTLGPDSPQSLVDALTWQFYRMFARRGGEGLRNVRASNFKFEELSGKTKITYTKLVQEHGLARTTRHHLEDPKDPRSFTSLFNHYMQRLSDSEIGPRELGNALWFTPNRNGYLTDGYWFKPTPIGLHTLNGFVKRVMSPFGDHYSNHSLKVIARSIIKEVPSEDKRCSQRRGPGRILTKGVKRGWNAAITDPAGSSPKCEKLLISLIRKKGEAMILPKPGTSSLQKAHVIDSSEVVSDKSVVPAPDHSAGINRTPTIAESAGPGVHRTLIANSHVPSNHVRTLIANSPVPSNHVRTLIANSPGIASTPPPITTMDDSLASTLQAMTEQEVLMALEGMRELVVPPSQNKSTNTDVVLPVGCSVSLSLSELSGVGGSGDEVLGVGGSGGEVCCCTSSTTKHVNTELVLNPRCCVSFTVKA